ncbi:N-acetyltransferase [Actinosynnema sp. NPDC023587]|uniref:GNAT family N-acetyltransferase n=1 Tax=Actinosynnema sp. NPDC023587 TaxID=3154695 RepID=UPI0033C2DDA0
MLIRRETPDDVQAITDVTDAAFAANPGGEAWLVGELRADPGWVPELSLVAESASGAVVGHVVCTRATVNDTPALGLGPLSVHPDHQRQGVGSALVHAVLGAADALGEPLVALLGDPAYYSRFGFRPAAGLGVDAPVPEWGAYFQVRALHAHRPNQRGAFRYAEPFERL